MFSLFDALEAIWDAICEIKDICFEKRKLRYKVLWIMGILLGTYVLLYFINKLYEFRGY
ncbi:hypothetical protein [uncultured Clostridium sp.]|uniref:hypothetical protein n=1 Tax=uncultured Clostridium sp. TaxID=59620 RepID=UPI00261273E0|nr:hypothetical protein [uncultured Clostridium sp.]